MKSKRIPTKVAARAAGPWLIATLLLLSPVAALGNGIDDGCGVAEACLGMSPQPDSPPSTGAHQRKTRDRASSVRAGDRKVSRSLSGSKKKLALTSPSFVATDASTAARLGKGRKP
jgi:hypothetical protein